MITERYRKDHQKIKVRCPCCGKVMSGWAYDHNWDGKYWIQHVVPNKKKECWATEEQMVAVRKAWEEKYEQVNPEDTDSN